MSFRIAWKPYMYSQTLPHLLGGVRAPALVVWGDDDQHRAARAPASATRRRCPRPGWRSSTACGHCVDMEQPEALAKLVTDIHRRELSRE